MVRLRLPAWIPPLPGTTEEAETGPPPIAEGATAHRVALPLTDARALPVSLSESWYVLGVRGSGKTRFAKRLARTLVGLYPGANLYVLDSKGGDDFLGWPGLRRDEGAPPPLPGAGAIQVWQPPYDDTDEYGAWLESILKAGQPAVVYVDELSSLAANNAGTSYPVGLSKVMKQGRSLGVCPIILTQEAAYNPRTVIHQAAHFVYFRLGRDDEHGIRAACKLLGLPRPGPGEPPPEPGHPWGFYYRPLLPAPGDTYEYRDLDEFFGGV